MDENIDAQIINYITETASQETKAYQLKFLAELLESHGEHLDLQLDKPLVRIFIRKNGRQLATLDVRNGEYVMTSYEEE